MLDTEAGAQASLEIFEYANSQLLQFRYYDDRLDSELERIYDSLELTVVLILVVELVLVFMGIMK